MDLQLIKDGHSRVYEGFSLTQEDYDKMPQPVKSSIDGTFIGEIELTDDGNHISKFTPKSKVSLERSKVVINEIVKAQGKAETKEKELDSELLDSHMSKFIKALNKDKELVGLASKIFSENMRVNTLTLEPINSSKDGMEFAEPIDREITEINLISKMPLGRGWVRGNTLVDTLEAELLQRIKLSLKEK